MKERIGLYGVDHGAQVKFPRKVAVSSRDDIDLIMNEQREMVRVNSSTVGVVDRHNTHVCSSQIGSP